jgi:hypothetical protein
MYTGNLMKIPNIKVHKHLSDGSYSKTCSGTDGQTDREADKIKQTVAFTCCHLKRSTYGENLQLFKKYCYCIRQEGLLLWDILAM